MRKPLTSGAGVAEIGAGACAERQRDILRRDGAVVIKHALPGEQIERAAAALAVHFARTPVGEGYFVGRRTRRFSGLIAKSPGHVAPLVAHEGLLAIVEPILRGQGWCDAVQLGLTQAIAIDPGERAQILHRDDNLFPTGHDRELLINVMWPLDVFCARNGATRIVLGSQNWDRALRPNEDAGAHALADPGDAIVWLGSVLHGGGANRSAAPRRGLVFQYSAAWLAQAEKLLLTTPPQIARQLPERLQRLIGYQVHRPNLGWIEERDPIEWLRGAIGDTAAAQDHFTPEMDARLEAAVRAAGAPR